jgi:hypothetical protein
MKEKGTERSDLLGAGLCSEYVGLRERHHRQQSTAQQATGSKAGGKNLVRYA